jgi:cytochrome c nitrite reductase small subunit
MKIKLTFLKKPWVILVLGIVVGAVLIISSKKAITYTNTNEFCQSCHIHPHAEDSWRQSSHYYNQSGMRVRCVDCHLPPEGDFKYLKAKVRTGLHDLYAFHFKDHESFDWEQKRQLEYAVKIVYNESCVECHQNLFTKNLSPDGGVAHLYYEQNAERLDLQCINCHLDVGHYNPDYSHERMSVIPVTGNTDQELYTEAAKVEGFENYTEKIPNSAVAFNMLAIPGGTFLMGSPDNEPLRNTDEGPVREVAVSPFFMGEIEVTWDEFWTFFGETMSEGRISPQEIMERNKLGVDGISGPTPPFGTPNQGWGNGKRPAITMTHYAAEMYCKWLSMVTGKTYRLPTEAEWEYACRGGAESPYFFDGNPKRFVDSGLRNRIFGVDTTNINTYAVYSMNSEGKTQLPSFVKPNPFGLKNMSGNVMEYCSDWYAPDAYAQTDYKVSNPTGPSSGTEKVVRGGHYASDAGELRSAARDHTKTEEWLKTDPQQPKSIWWYSDVKGIGFRVVCDPESAIHAQLESEL